ncbi:phospholipid scramblase-related protein [Hyalangium rubrum]|uniref:Phospholipid scramblase-related protein n=1 Tax=Hyalangium rubrum TaxID=3103134 RepID=A0ABU5GYL4_9BACT|nr:phospholipid scramblase-related protein [Hyalangium sp. s54d21]MDY7225794.1 phospholipid scramblase-related protein [Hyalangium sp. s54d21]
MPPESTALAPLLQHRALRVRQTKEWAEILTGFEGRNRYQVVGDNGQPLFFAGEVGSGVGLFLVRSFFKAKRPFTMELKTPTGVTALRLRRPLRLLFSHMKVEDGEGRLLGSIQQRFAFFSRIYEVRGPSGEVLGRLRGPLFSPWTFILEENGKDVGRIQKRWGGLGKEMFSEADNFGVVFEKEQDARLRTLAVAATFLIDFVHFENYGV